MSPIPIFPHKSQPPTQKQLAEVLGEQSFKVWSEIEAYVLHQYPRAVCEWNFPGIKYGWSYRLKDKKRAIIYLLPADGFFNVAFVFGQKASTHILGSTVADSIKTELQQARVYAEGRGIRLEVRDASFLEDVKQLVNVKLSY